MSCEKCWQWEHFHRGHERIDKAHWQAFCKYCTAAQLCLLEEQEQKAVKENRIKVARSKDLLLSEGKIVPNSIQAVQ
jgi:hypothetical protein